MFSFKKLIDEACRPLVMGIINVTPDSFSDGGEAFDIDAVIEKVNTLCDEGADIIDVGACSTAPKNAIVSEDEEIWKWVRTSTKSPPRRSWTIFLTGSPACWSERTRSRAPCPAASSRCWPWAER